MSAVLGLDSEEIKKLIKENFSEIKCYLANDNSNGQFIVSGLNKELKKFNLLCQEKKIKNIPLSVSAPFHCELMRNATVKMESIIKNQKFSELKYKVVSNVTAKKYNNSDEVKKLLSHIFFSISLEVKKSVPDSFVRFRSLFTNSVKSVPDSFCSISLTFYQL